MAKWYEISSLNEWEKVLESSITRNVLLFKHSTTCPISANAWREYQEYVDNTDVDVDFYMVKVIESRPISNQIAEPLLITI